MTPDIFLGPILGLLVAILIILGRMEKRISALSRIDRKFDALLKHLDANYDPLADFSAGISEALKSGNKIDAIKQYREATGVTLIEAKEHIEDLQRRETS